MMHKIFLVIALLGLTACATAPMDRDGGIGGTGAPVAAQPLI